MRNIARESELAQKWVGLVSFSERGGEVEFVGSKWRLIYSSALLLSALSSEELSPVKVRDHYTFNTSKLATRNHP